MTGRVARLALILAIAALGQEPPPEPVPFVCPMDRDVRAKGPGKCPRCGMALEPGIPTPVEYPVRLRTRPARFKAGAKAHLEFEVLDPATGERLTSFKLVHEKLFHVFLLSQDLEYFAHEHPERGPDGIFRLEIALPKPGLYRVACDFYPEGGTPQLALNTLLTAGYRPAVHAFAKLAPDLAGKRGENLKVELETEPPQPLAGKKTLLFFRLKPAEALEPYLGAWGHLLAASQDLIDLIHSHPAIADGGPQVQFNLIFPREGFYRLWVQFQRYGKVNTVSFTVPVSALK